MFVATPADVPFVTHDQGDIWLPAALLIAMRRGEDLVLRDPISDARRAALDQIQDVLVGWYPQRMRRVRVHAPPSDAPRGAKGLVHGVADRTLRRRGTASCFTGGADSFYTLVTNPDVDTLLYAFGLDVPLTQTAAIRRIDRDLRVVAAERGARYLWMRTNLRAVLKGARVLWGLEAHGSVLAALGTVASTRVSTLRIPATFTHGAGIPWGSDPDLDPLWSTERLRVIHDGADASRGTKVLRLAGEPLAQRHLRVCFAQFAVTNCGRCLKCLRTMATLSLVGRLDEFETFTNQLDLEHLQSLVLTNDTDVFQMRDLRRLAQAHPGHEDVEQVADSLIRAYEAELGLQNAVAAGG